MLKALARIAIQAEEALNQSSLWWRLSIDFAKMLNSLSVDVSVLAMKVMGLQ